MLRFGAILASGGRLSRRRWLVQTLTAATTMALGGAGLVGCGGGQRPTTVLKPLEERRARALIEEAMVENGVTPRRPRRITLPSSNELTEDMAIDGSRYGVAYVTAPEFKDLAGSIPAFDPDSDELKLVRGQQGEVVLVLYEDNYRYDAGDLHTTNAVTAERKLKRDVTDYLLHVVKPDKVK